MHMLTFMIAWFKKFLRAMVVYIYAIRVTEACFKYNFQLSIKNGLFIDESPSVLNLSELESVLIAKIILFFKLFKLSKTRWAGMRDKLVNVLINDDDLTL